MWLATGLSFRRPRCWWMKWFSKDISMLFLFQEQHSPSIPMCYCPMDRGNLSFVRDFNIHFTKDWDSHFIVYMNKVSVLWSFIPLSTLWEGFNSKGVPIRNYFKPQILSLKYLFTTDLVWSNTSSYSTHHLECFLLISWIYILFPQLHCKIINDKVCFLEKPLHPKKNTCKYECLATRKCP